MNVQFGDVFYSKHFGSRGVVVKYVNEKEWYFVLEDRYNVLKAQARPEDVHWLKDSK